MYSPNGYGDNTVLTVLNRLVIMYIILFENKIYCIHVLLF